MGETVIITDDEPKPAKSDVVVVGPAPEKKPESIVVEKTTVTETRVD